MLKTIKKCRFNFIENLLVLGDASSALKASALFRLRLDNSDRTLLAVSVLLSCDPDEIVACAEAALEQNIFGLPLPPFSTLQQDAQWWVDRATIEERMAFLVTIYTSLTKKLQRDFNDFIAKEEKNECVFKL